MFSEIFDEQSIGNIKGNHNRRREIGILLEAKYFSKAFYDRLWFSVDNGKLVKFARSHFAKLNFYFHMDISICKRHILATETHFRTSFTRPVAQINSFLRLMYPTGAE